MSNFYAASLVEAKAFLDEVGVHPVTVSPGDPILGALVGLLDAAVVTQNLATSVGAAVHWLQVLDPPA